MLITRWMLSKNKKGMTLVEMIVAIAVTAILAVCLSMVMSPVMNTYSVNKARAELASYADKMLGYVAMDLRGATEVRVTQNIASTPGKAGYYAYFACDEYRIKNVAQKGDFYLSRCDYHYDYHKIFMPPDVRSNYDEATDSEMKKEFDYIKDLWPASSDHPALVLWHYKDFAFNCNNIQLYEKESFYALVRKDPYDGSRGDALELHLKVKKGKVSYEASKTIVCENLVIKGGFIMTAVVQLDDPAVISTSSDPNSSKNTKYYSIWFLKDKIIEDW